MASDDPAAPNLMHLAADLLDPDLDLETADLAELMEDGPEDIAAISPALRPDSVQALGGVSDYEFVARYQGSDMTDVFLAHKQSKFGFVRRAVVKRAKPESAMYEISREMLLDEAKALAWLDHPNIVSILDFSESEDGFYLAIEHVDGTDLRYVNMTLRKRREALPLEIACFLSIEILRGLHHAHTIVDPEGQALDILHRDVNPTNVLISKSGHVKLTDFGVVRMRDRLQARTQPGIVKGKFSYMAREYILGRKCDCRVDVYAVGIMLFEMLTGRSCFSKLSVHEVMTRIVEHDLPLDRMEDQDIPERLCKIVHKATSRDPEDRYQSANSMANDLETWLMRSGGHASPWIVSAFFEQHGLFRSKAKLPEPPRPSAAITKNETIAEHIDENSQKTSEVLANAVVEETDDPDAAGHAPDEPGVAIDDVKTTVNGRPEAVRLEPVGDADIIPLDDDDDEPEEPGHHVIDPDAPWSGTIGALAGPDLRPAQTSVAVAEVLEALVRCKASGEIRFENRAILKRIYVLMGQCVAVSTNVGMEDLTELLIKQNVLKRTELDRMMLGRKVSDQDIGLRLIEEDKITRERFAKIQGQQIQACLEDVLTWRSGEFSFEPQEVVPPKIIPNIHIELILLPHLSELVRTRAPRPKSIKALKSQDKNSLSLEDALRMARKVTRGHAHGRIDRIDAEDE